MASCQQFDIAEVPFQEEEKQMSADYNMSSKGNEDVEFGLTCKVPCLSYPKIL